MRVQILGESGRCFAGFAARALETRGVGAAWAIGLCIGDVSVSVRGSVVRRG